MSTLRKLAARSREGLRGADRYRDLRQRPEHPRRIHAIDEEDDEHEMENVREEQEQTNLLMIPRAGGAAGTGARTGREPEEELPHVVEARHEVAEEHGPLARLRSEEEADRPSIGPKLANRSTEAVSQLTALREDCRTIVTARKNMKMPQMT